MPEKRSPQHQLLLNLEQQGEKVFYAAPRFYNDKDFCLHYQQRHIVHNSAFIMPSAIGALPDRNEHYVSFDRFANFGWLLSEPVEVERILGGDELIKRMLEDLVVETPIRDRLINTFRRMRDALAAVRTREEIRIFEYRDTQETSQVDRDIRFSVYEDYDTTVLRTEDIASLFRRLEFLAHRDFHASVIPIYRHE